MTIPFRYTDKQAPPPSENVFKVAKIDSDGRPAYRVHVQKASIMALRNFNKIMIIEGKTVKIQYATFAVNLTISPNETGEYQLLFQVLEYGERTQKRGPIFWFREHCEWIF